MMVVPKGRVDVASNIGTHFPFRNRTKFAGKIYEYDDFDNELRIFGISFIVRRKAAYLV
jgi:hypothetical protein